MFNELGKYGNEIALIGEKNEEITYKRLVLESDKIQKNIKKNSLILLICKNSIESIIGYISFLKNDHITIIADANFEKKYLYRLVNIYKPRYIYSQRNFFNQKHLKEIYTLREFSLFENYKYTKAKINKQNYLLLSTSGSTGNPKFVRISKDNILDNTKKIIDYLNIKSNHTTITTMPMAYSYGLSIINTHLKQGAKIIVNNHTIFDKIFWNKINTFNVNSFGGVPEFYKYLERLKFEKFKIKSLNYITQAGGKLQKSQFAYMSKVCKLKKIKFYSMYGQTEASPRMSYLSPNKVWIKKGSIGKPLKHTSFLLYDENNKKINRSFQKGELVFKGKNVSLGYAKNIKDLANGDVNNKILHTGDIAYKDRQNYYYIVGRKNKFIKLYGIRFNLEDIDKSLKKNGINAKCISKNDKLFVISREKSNEMKIKKIINQNFKIRNNEISISSKFLKENKTNFKF